MGLRVLLGAEVTRHALALDDAARIGSRSNGSRPPMLRIAVSIGTATETVALHDTLKTTTLRRPGDFDLIARREDADTDGIADFEGRDFDRLRAVVEAYGAENGWRRREAGLGRMTNSRLRRATPTRRPLVFLRFATDPLRA